MDGPDAGDTAPAFAAGLAGARTLPRGLLGAGHAQPLLHHGIAAVLARPAPVDAHLADGRHAFAPLALAQRASRGIGRTWFRRLGASSHRAPLCRARAEAAGRLPGQ